MGGCATSVPARGHSIVRIDYNKVTPAIPRQKNLESYHLFWLDNTAKSPEFIEMHDEMRSIINYVRIFESQLPCQKEFEKITNGKIFFIVNCQQSLSILPIVHDHKQLHSIYIYYNGNKIDMEQIASNYKKIRGIYDSFFLAKRYLEDDIEMHTELDEPMVIDLVTKIDHVEYEENFHLFVKTVNVKATDIYDTKTQKQLIKMCKDYYDGNDTEISLIEEFSRQYKPDQAISWYLRKSCLHRLLVRAFNDCDMTVLVDMYSFIADINRNLQKDCVKQSSELCVYRGQFLSDKDLSLLKEHMNEIITMQCFFSAQTSRDETLHLLQSIEPNDADLKRILFEICISQDYTFVDTHRSSTSKTVLFMLGSQFKIIDVNETTVVLSQNISPSNNNYDLTNESPVIIQGIFTYLKEGARKSIQYFEGILREESSIDLLTRSSIYGQLGYLKQKSGDINGATQMYEQVINHGKMQFGLYLFYLDQAAQYYADVLKDWEKAKNLWLEKLNIQNAILSKEETVQTYENLVRATIELKQYDKTIEYISAAMQILPKDHPHIVTLQQQLEYAKNNLS